MTISFENLIKSQPLARALADVRAARAEMNQAPGKLAVHQLPGSGASVTHVTLPNVVVRNVLDSEEARLVYELGKLGVQA